MQEEGKLPKKVLLERQWSERTKVAADEVAEKVQNALKSYFLQTEREYSGHMNEEQWLRFMKVNMSLGTYIACGLPTSLKLRIIERIPWSRQN